MEKEKIIFKGKQHEIKINKNLILTKTLTIFGVHSTLSIGKSLKKKIFTLNAAKHLLFTLNKIYTLTSIA